MPTVRTTLRVPTEDKPIDVVVTFHDNFSAMDIISVTKVESGTQIILSKKQIEQLVERCLPEIGDCYEGDIPLIKEDTPTSMVCEETGLCVLAQDVVDMSAIYADRTLI